MPSDQFDFGQRLASQITDAVLIVEQDVAQTPQEQIQFWTGFLSHVVGGMSARIGPASTVIIGTALKPIVDEIQKSNLH